MTAKSKKKRVKKVVRQKESVRQLLFGRYYLSETIDGRSNPTFLKAKKSAIKAGYSPTYAANILTRIEKLKNSAMGKKVEKSRVLLLNELKTLGIDATWLGRRIKEMGDSKRQGLFRGKFINSKQPDPFAVRAAMEFLAKLQGLFYADETHPNDPYNLNGKTKEELFRIATGGAGEESSSSD